MPILLFLIAVLTAGVFAPASVLAQSASTPIPTDEYGHLAEVIEPGAKSSKMMVVDTSMTVERKPEPPAAPAAPEPAPAPVATPVAVVEPAPTPATEPDPEPEPIPAPEPESAGTPLTGDWVVQVGAFGTMEAAERGAELTGRDGVVIMPIRQDGKDWYVVLLGSYDSRSEADDTGRGYMNETGDSYWVRQSSGLLSTMLSGVGATQ